MASVPSRFELRTERAINDLFTRIAGNPIRWALGTVVAGLLLGWMWHGTPAETAAAIGLLLLLRFAMLWLGIYLGLVIPMIAVGVRRLHDIDRTGWWLLAPVLPYAIGFALMFPNYSTWEGRAGIYLEDLFVSKWARRHGVGDAAQRPGRQGGVHRVAAGPR